MHAQVAVDLVVQVRLIEIGQDRGGPEVAARGRDLAAAVSCRIGQNSLGLVVAVKRQGDLLEVVAALHSPRGSLAACTAGNSIATRMPMIAMTTSSSTRVNPRRLASQVWNLPTALPPYECARCAAGRRVNIPSASAARRPPQHGPGGQQCERPRLRHGRGSAADGASPTALRQ